MAEDGEISVSSIIKFLVDRNAIRPPPFVETTHYEVIVGSVMYGVSDDLSDMDINGFCIPPKEVVFPHLAGEIDGFSRQKKRFEQFQQHHIREDSTNKEYDITIYSIVKFFMLCMENNPNMLDCLFAPDNVVLHITSVGNMVRDKRKLFLHKGSWPKFKGYSYSQLHKARSKDPQEGSKRAAIREKYGFDVKFLYHVVRLLLECEMILQEGDIDIQRHREHLKAIRRGDVSQDEIEKWFSEKEKHLEKMYETSSLRYSPPEQEIKQLLIDCLEHHYGSIANCVSVVPAATLAINKIVEIVNQYQRHVQVGEK